MSGLVGSGAVHTVLPREALWWPNAPDSIYLFHTGCLPVQIGRAGTNRICFTTYISGGRVGSAGPAGTLIHSGKVLYNLETLFYNPGKVFYVCGVAPFTI